MVERSDTTGFYWDKKCIPPGCESGFNFSDDVTSFNHRLLALKPPVYLSDTSRELGLTTCHSGQCANLDKFVQSARPGWFQEALHLGGQLGQRPEKSLARFDPTFASDLSGQGVAVILPPTAAQRNRNEVEIAGGK